MHSGFICLIIVRVIIKKPMIFLMHINFINFVPTFHTIFVQDLAYHINLVVSSCIEALFFIAFVFITGLSFPN